MAAKKELIDTDPTPEPIDYDSIADDLQWLYENPKQPLAVDTEATGLFVHDGRDKAIGISYATLTPNGTPRSGYLGFDHPVGESAPRELVDQLAYVLEQEERPLIFQGAQFDMNSLLTADIDVRGNEFYDLPSMACLIDENMPAKGMDAIAKRFAPHVEKLTEDTWLNNEKKTGWKNTTPERMNKYATNDAEVTFVSWDEMITHPEWRALHESVWPHKQRTIRALLSMRRLGVRLDPEPAQYMADRGNKRMAEILEELGYVNLGPKALTDLLLDKLQLPVLGRSAKTGDPSFKAEYMAEYDEMLERDGSDLGKLIFEYRGWQKAVSAGYAAYLDKVSPDGRVRTEYTTHVTRTGRLSSKEPNLQQIPKDEPDPEKVEKHKLKKPWNWQMKAVFIASEGYKMWSIDYSQLELRLMAAFAGVQELKQVFIEGRDIFDEMAEALGYPRQDIKTFVYANSYGAGDAKIARSLGTTVAKAKKLRTDYYAQYPGLAIFSRRLQRMAERNKKFPLWSGRYRHMPYPREAYKAMNSFIQGGGADVVERAMVRVYEEVCNNDCRMLMQVHDAFVFEIKEGKEHKYLPRIEEIMCDVDFLIEERIPEGLGTSIAVETDAWPIFEWPADEENENE